MIMKVNFFDLCMQTFENIPKNPEKSQNDPKNPDCDVQNVYHKFRHIPVWVYRGVPHPGIHTPHFNKLVKNVDWLSW